MRKTYFVLLFTKKEISNSTSKKPIKYNVFFLILLGLYLIYNFLQNDWVSFVFNMVSIIGVYISFEIFSEKFGITSKTLNSICGHTEKKTDSSCSKIINSDSINIFGLKLSDFSLIYFVTIVILGLLLPNTSVLLQITSLKIPRKMKRFTFTIPQQRFIWKAVVKQPHNLFFQNLTQLNLVIRKLSQILLSKIQHNISLSNKIHNYLLMLNLHFQKTIKKPL